MASLPVGGGVREIFVPLALTESGWRRDVVIAIKGRDILSVTPEAPPPPRAERFQGIAVPGLANVHSHAFQRAMAGRAEQRATGDDSFWTWRQAMYRLVQRLRPEDIEAIAGWLNVELLECGFTSVGEFHYLHHAGDGSPYQDPAEMAGRIVAAAAESGIGLTLLPAFYAHGGCGGRPPAREQARFLTDLDGFFALMAAAARHVASLPGAILGCAAHSLRAVDAGELLLLAERFATGPIHMHAAEQIGEVEECIAWSGARPVQWLIDSLGLDRRWCLIHATHMIPEEAAALARSGAVVGLCPITEANLGDGIFEAPGFLKAGGRLAIGSDSNVRVSLTGELSMLEYGQRLRDRRRNRIAATGASTGRQLFDAARRGGAQALASASGALLAGRVADIVILDDSHPALACSREDEILDSWIFASGEGVVRDVFAGGRHLVSLGRHAKRDPLLRRFLAALRRLAQEA